MQWTKSRSFLAAEGARMQDINTSAANGLLDWYNLVCVELRKVYYLSWKCVRMYVLANVWVIVFLVKKECINFKNIRHVVDSSEDGTKVRVIGTV